MTSTLKSFGKQALIYGTGNVLARLVTFLLLPLLTNVLSVEEYGMVALIYVFLGFMNIVYHYGIDSAFMRFAGEIEDPTELRKRFSTAFWLSVVTSTALSLIIASLARPISQLIVGSSDSEKLFVYCAGILLLDTIAIVPLAFLRLMNRAGQFTTIRMLNVLTTLGLSIYFVAVMEMGITGVFLSVLVASTVTAVGSFLTALPEIRFSFSTIDAKNLMKFGLPFIPAGVASIAMEMIDRIILLQLKGTATVGIYSAGYKLGIFMLLITTAFNYAWQPFFLKQGDQPESKPLFSRIFTLYVSVAAFVWLTITLFIPEIIRINISGYSLIGSDYYSAEIIVSFILIAYVLQGAYFNFLPGIYFAKKTGYIALATASGAVVNIILNYILIPPYGITGAALATIFGHGTMAVTTYFISRLFFKVPYQWGRVMGILVFAGAAVLLAQLLGGTILARLGAVLLFVSLILGSKIIFPKKYTTSSGQDRVFLFSSLNLSFIRRDAEAISSFANMQFVTASGLSAILKITTGVISSNVVISWFTSTYSAWLVFLGRLLGKRTILILGGADVSADKELNYGIWLSRWRRPLLRYAFRKADMALAVAPSIIEKAKAIANYSGANLHYLPTGVDTERWSPSSIEKKGVLTVAACNSSARLRIKGVDLLVEAASKMSNTTFTLIGTEPTLLEKVGLVIPSNLQIVPFLSEAELITHYQDAKVYCQPSRTEGMPNTLMEAMSCGSVPVGSDVGGISVLIDATGSVIPANDVDVLVQALQDALGKDDTAGKAARQRIIDEFSIEKRIAGLREAIEGETEK